MAMQKFSEEIYAKLMALRNAQAGFARLLGIQVTHMACGTATVAMDIQREDLLNTTGTTIHGGVIFTVADTASGAAATSSGFYCATSSADLHYVNPALSSTQLIGNAVAIKLGKRLFVFDVEVRNEADVLIAKGLFSYMPLDRRVLEA